MPAARAPGRTRDHLLNATIAVMAEHGHSGVTTQRVADAAGVDKALLHYYFGTKAGLIAAVVEHLGDALLDDVARAITGLDDPSSVVAAGFSAIWAHVLEQPRLHAVWLSLTAAAVSDDALRPAVAQLRDRYRKMIGGGLQAMVDAGWRSRLSEHATVTIVLAAIDGFTVALLEEGRTAALDEAIAETELTLSQLMRNAR